MDSQLMYFGGAAIIVGGGLYYLYQSSKSSAESANTGSGADCATDKVKLVTSSLIPIVGIANVVQMAATGQTEPSSCYQFIAATQATVNDKVAQSSAIDQAYGGTNNNPNFNNIMDSLNTSKQTTTPDAFGCMDTSYTTDINGKVITNPKICGDASVCSRWIDSGTAFGAAYAAGTTSCGVTGGNQTDTVTFLDAATAHSIAAAQLAAAKAGTITVADLNSWDYSASGTVVPDDQIIPKITSITTATFPAAVAQYSSAIPSLTTKQSTDLFNLDQQIAALQTTTKASPTMASMIATQIAALQKKKDDILSSQYQ